MNSSGSVFYRKRVADEKKKFLNFCHLVTRLRQCAEDSARYNCLLLQSAVASAVLSGVLQAGKMRVLRKIL
ncbi:MAG: hypothetical protein DME59_18640 [Verrucomicrobia bacterium]|nr:MAG: hypothetical protein DME59_18640 [Verrucomicrobiota bacterium]